MTANYKSKADAIKEFASPQTLIAPERAITLSERTADGTNPQPRPSLLVTAAFCVGIVTFALFGPARHFEFLNFDDDVYVTDNPFVNGGLSRENIQQAFAQSRGGHWHPLTWLTHMADVSLWGLDPAGHHLGNIVLHSLNAALFCLLVGTLTRSTYLGASIALLFSLSPLRLEAVVWIAERKEVLCDFFMLIALLLHVRYARLRLAGRAPFSGSMVRQAGAILLCGVLALLAKPVAVTLPGLMLLLDLWPLRRVPLSGIRRSLSTCLLEKVPLTLCTIALSVVTVLSQAKEGALQPIPWDDRLAMVGVSYLAYLGKFFVPGPIAIFYPFQRFAPGIAAGAALALTAITLLVRKTPAALFGWVWLLVSLAPVIGFIPFGGQLFADRWSYVGHMGLYVGLGCLLAERCYGFVRFALTAPFVLGTAYLLHSNLPYWRDSEALFRHTLDVVPGNFMAHTNLGVALQRSGRTDEAALHFEEAARLNPGYPEALNNLGILRAREGRISEARSLFERTVEKSPGFFAARYNLGLSQYDLGERVAALISWMETLNSAPGYRPALASLGTVQSRAPSESCGERLSALGINGPASPKALEQYRGALSRMRTDPALGRWLERTLSCLATSS